MPVLGTSVGLRRRGRGDFDIRLAASVRGGWLLPECAQKLKRELQSYPSSVPKDVKPDWLLWLVPKTGYLHAPAYLQVPYWLDEFGSVLFSSTNELADCSGTCGTAHPLQAAYIKWCCPALPMDSMQTDWPTALVHHPLYRQRA